MKLIEDKYLLLVANLFFTISVVFRI